MKTSLSIWKSAFRRAEAGALFIGLCLAGTIPATGQDTNAPAKPEENAKPPAAKAAEADETELNNWLEFGVGGNIVSGDKAQFQRQTGLPAGPFGGVEAFHYEHVVDKKGLFSVDGRGIFDNHDYDLKLEISHPDKGFFRAGYREFREYYDGSGGYFPGNGLWFNLYDNRLAVTRGDAFFEAGLTRPDWPVITFRYDHQFRNGQKDSTEWGTTTLTGPGQTLNAASQKKIAPAFRDINETRDIFQLDVAHTIKLTDLGIGFRYELERNNDSKNIYMQPNQGALSRVLVQQDGTKADMFNVHAFTDTRLNEKVEFTSGYSFTTLNADITGSRLDSPGATTFDTRFTGLVGSAEVKQYVMNLNLMFSPSDNVYIVPAIRVEKRDTSGSVSYNNINNTTQALTPNAGASDEGALYVTESLDLRYTGITNWAFYARGEWSEDRADLKMQSGAAAAPPTIFDGVWNRLYQKYTVGANWYPLRHLNFAGQYYHKISQNDYDNTFPAAHNNYPGFLEHQRFDVDDVNFRVTWRPFSTLTLVSRYDFQWGTIRTTGGQFPIGNQLAEVQSGNHTTHMFGETVSWTPVHRLYLQLSGNYVLDETHTPVEDLAGQANLVQRSRNNYWTVTSLVGYAIDDRTDVQAQYSYFRTGNYLDNSAVSLPYGAGAEEHTVSLTLGRQLNRNLRCTLRYGYANYRDQTSGGFLNFSAHSILSTLQYRF